MNTLGLSPSSLSLKGWLLIASSLLLAAKLAPAAQGEDNAAIAAVRKSAEKLLQDFNAAKADEVAGTFLPDGEMIDEDGTVYRGTAEIKELLDAFFKKYPGAKLSVNVESGRAVGPVVIDEGTRTMTTANGAEKSRFRYLAIWAKTDQGWRLASFRDFSEVPEQTPHDHLQPIAWIVGDWINEGTDGKVAITYRWSEDKNFLLGEFMIKGADGQPRKSTQRIGWDPAVGKIRSWLFDADGGFAEGQWTLIDGGIVIKSSSVNPDGTGATATMNITPKDKDHFTIHGTDRIIGDQVEDDFELTIARRPPVAGN
jgi:uncharacterized protein (TIGR02246 family)